MKKTKDLALFVLCCVFAAPGFAGKQDGWFDIYWIDVEGGAATLMVMPDDECVLIDTGNPGRRDPNRILKVVGEVAGLRAIDHLITTHYHRDHFGGAQILSTIIPIRNVYDNGVFDGLREHPGAAYFEFQCEKRHVISPGDFIPLRMLDASKIPVSLQCIATRKQFVTPEKVNAKPNHDAEKLHRPKDRDGSDNANSVVMLLSIGGFEFFDGGDLTWNQEKKLVHPFNLVGEVDVYQVTHHGLDSSNNPIVLQSLQPRVAVMNNGHTKGCLPEVFGNLMATKSLKALYQVHKNLRPDGNMNNVADEFIANLQDKKDCQGNFIKLSLAADSKSYTVSIPANRHLATYQTK